MVSRLAGGCLPHFPGPLGGSSYCYLLGWVSVYQEFRNVVCSPAIWGHLFGRFFRRVAISLLSIPVTSAPYVVAGSTPAVNTFRGVTLDLVNILNLTSLLWALIHLPFLVDLLSHAFLGLPAA